VNTANPCRCAKKTQGFAKAGYLNPEKLLFAREHVMRVREIAEKRCEDLDALDGFKLTSLDPKLAPYHLLNTALNIQGSRVVNMSAECSIRYPSRRSVRSTPPRRPDASKSVT